MGLKNSFRPKTGKYKLFGKAPAQKCFRKRGPWWTPDFRSILYGIAIPEVLPKTTEVLPTEKYFRRGRKYFRFTLLSKDNPVNAKTKTENPKF